MQFVKRKCPICEEGLLVDHVVSEEKEYHRTKGSVALEYSECSFCGSEQANSAQTRANKRAMIAFKKEIDGLLIGEQIRALRNRYQITQSQAARIFGGGPVAFSKYESDDVMQSEAMDNLLRMADRFPQMFYALADKAGVDVESERHLKTKFFMWQHRYRQTTAHLSQMLLGAEQSVTRSNIVRFDRLETHIEDSSDELSRVY